MKPGMRHELTFVNNQVPGGIYQECGLWYYTPALAHKVTFKTAYNINRLHRIENDWSCVLQGGTLDFAVRTLQTFGPFLTPQQVHDIWEHEVSYHPLLVDLNNTMNKTGVFRNHEELWFFVQGSGERSNRACPGPFVGTQQNLGRCKYKITVPGEKYWLVRCDFNDISYPMVESGDLNQVLAVLALDGPYQIPLHPDYHQADCVNPSSY